MFIAGSVVTRSESTEELSERVRAFSILPGESDADYEQSVIATPIGYLILKYKHGHPVRPQIARDADGNALVILGMMLSGDAEELLPGAVRSGGLSLEECEGGFVAIFFAAAANDIHIVNDRFASRPFYIRRRENETFFSSNLAFLLTLAGTSYRPDVGGWLEVCTVGHTLGTRTTADGVERLAPATHLTVALGKMQVRRYWRLEHRPEHSLDAGRHSDAVFEAFRTGVSRRVGLINRGTLALSGGLDSRLLAGALPRSSNYSALTFVDTPAGGATSETRSAVAVATALGLRHHLVSTRSHMIDATDVVTLTGGMRPYHHMAYAMAYVDSARSQAVRFLIGGGPGDSLAGAFVPSAAYLDPQRSDECIDDAYRRRIAEFSAGMFRDEIVQAGRSGVAAAIRQSFADVGGPTAAHRVTAWAMVYRQTAFTFTTTLHTHPDVAEAFCHLDYRYTDLMLQLPASWLYNRSFYSYMVHRSLPDLRHIPYANTGRLLSGEPPASSDSVMRRGLDVVRSFKRKVLGRLRPSVAPSILSDAVLLDQILECVHSIPHLREILDLKRCDEMVAQTREGACPSQETMGTLASISLTSATL